MLTFVQFFTQSAGFFFENCAKTANPFYVRDFGVLGYVYLRNFPNDLGKSERSVVEVGGYGSGPYGHMGSKTGKTATGRCLFLDIRKLKRDELLRPGKSFSWSWTTTLRGETSQSSIGIKILSQEELQLNYTCTINGVSTPVETNILLAFSRCNYGNARAWFHCPSCHKRVALLYQKGLHFRCRHCHDLTYYSCQESGNFTDEAERRANAILVKLKNKKQHGFDIMYYRPTRPKGMHWNTWCRLQKEFESAQLEYIRVFSDKMSSFGCLAM